MVVRTVFQVSGWMFLRKVNLWKDCKIFINSEIRAKIFWTFGKDFRRSYQNSLVLVQSELLRKKNIWRLFQFGIICGNWAFFWFLAKVFHLLSIMRFGCPQERVQIFFAATFLLLSFSVFEQEFFDFWPSFFFDAITGSAFYVYGGKFLWIFPELFSFFSIFETLSGKLCVLAEIGSRFVKTAFLRVQKGTVKTNFFGRSFNFSSFSDISHFFFTFGKKTFGMVVNAAVYLYRRTFWKCVSF